MIPKDVSDLYDYWQCIASILYDKMSYMLSGPIQDEVDEDEKLRLSAQMSWVDERIRAAWNKQHA